jgi:integrase
MPKVAQAVSATRNKTVLTHRGVEALRGEAVAFRVPDLRCPGLAIRVAQSGLKTWDVAFRIRGTGKGRRLSLGPFPAVTLEAARARTAALTKAAQAGRDLLAEEEAAKAKADGRTTLSALIEHYLNRMVRGRLRTAFEIETRLKRTLRPLNDRYAEEIHRRDLRPILEKAAERGKLREAEKQRQLMRVLFRWAQSQDIIESDPTAGIASYGTSRRRDRVLSSNEIRLLWEWIESCSMPRDYADTLKLQLAIGARVGEVGGLAAAEINQESWLWTLPAARSKNGRPRATPLVGLAREIVASRLQPFAEGPLFRTEAGAPLTANCVASLLVKRRRGIPIAHFTSHDLRRTVATGLVDLGFSYDIVAAALGHEAGGKDVRTLIRHYVRTDMIEQKRAALRAWDAQLRQIVYGEHSAASPGPQRDLHAA